MRRAFFFILAVLFANASFALIPRVSILDDAPAIDTPSAETRVRASDVLAPFERPAEGELTRALRQGYEQAGTTNASGLGRFLSVDPTWASADLTKPQSWNRYSYVENTPINKVDPDGKAGVLAVLGVLDKAADAIGLAYDVYTIAKEGPNNENLKQLALDVGLTVAPVPGNIGAVKAVGGVLGAAAGFFGLGSKGAKLADGAVVIGKMADLNKPGALKAGERTLALPGQGNPRADWKQNSSRLREAMASGKPIRDASVDATGKLRDNTGFLQAERDILRNKGWTYDQATRLWSAPKR